MRAVFLEEANAVQNAIISRAVRRCYLISKPEVPRSDATRRRSDKMQLSMNPTQTRVSDPMEIAIAKATKQDTTQNLHVQEKCTPSTV